MLFLIEAPKAFELQFAAGSEQIFAEPHDLVLSPDGRHLYVADNSNDRIAVLDPESLELLGTFGGGEVGAPHDVAFTAKGKLLVADTANDRIAIYEVTGASGTLVGELTGAISRPEGVVVHPSGRIYATGAGSGNVEIFDEGQSVAEAGHLSAPHDLAIGPDGTIWIADAGNDRLVQMSQELEVLQIMEGPPYHFDGPRYLDFDDQGRLYVADKYTNRIKVLAPDGELLLVLGEREAGLGPNLFDRPEGVAIRGKDVWFSDTYNDRIVRYLIEE